MVRVVVLHFIKGIPTDQDGTADGREISSFSILHLPPAAGLGQRPEEPYTYRFIHSSSRPHGHCERPCGPCSGSTLCSAEDNCRTSRTGKPSAWAVQGRVHPRLITWHWSWEGEWVRLTRMAVDLFSGALLVLLSLFSYLHSRKNSYSLFQPPLELEVSGRGSFGQWDRCA